MLLNALSKVKNGKSSGSCAYSIDLVKHHKHVQLNDALAMFSKSLSHGVPNESFRQASGT